MYIVRLFVNPTELDDTIKPETQVYTTITETYLEAKEIANEEGEGEFYKYAYQDNERRWEIEEIVRQEMDILSTDPLEYEINYITKPV